MGVPAAQFSKVGPDPQYLKTEERIHPPISSQPLTGTLQQTAVATLRVQTIKTSSNRVQCWKFVPVHKPGQARREPTEPTSPVWRELHVMVTKCWTLPQANKPQYAQLSKTAILLLACWWFRKTYFKLVSVSVSSGSFII